MRDLGARGDDVVVRVDGRAAGKARGLTGDETTRMEHPEAGGVGLRGALDLGSEGGKEGFAN